MTPAWPAAVAVMAAAALLVSPLGSSWAARSRLRQVTGVGARHPRRTGTNAVRGVLLQIRPAWTGFIDVPGSTAVIAAAAGAVGLLGGGPVAAVVAAVYGALAVRVLRRRGDSRRDARRRTAELDRLCALAADLRAGLPPVATDTGSVERVPRSISRVEAAIRLAESTGAPLADLVERVEADARAVDRAITMAAAQAAGARATSWLLAGLPLGGIVLGYSIGVDPLHLLLRTPLGAACALCSVLLQVAGLVWTDRLVDAPVRRLDVGAPPASPPAQVPAELSRPTGARPVQVTP